MSWRSPLPPSLLLPRKDQAVDLSVQYCRGDRDLGGDFYAKEDADEIRVWCEDGTLIVSVSEDAFGVWSVDHSDVVSVSELRGVLGSRAAALSYIEAVMESGDVVVRDSWV